MNTEMLYSLRRRNRNTEQAENTKNAERRKTRFLKSLVENAYLSKPVLKIIMHNALNIIS